MLVLAMSVMRVSVMGVPMIALDGMRSRHVGAMMPERHALSGSHGSEPLQRHGEHHDKDDQQTRKPGWHGFHSTDAFLEKGIGTKFLVRRVSCGEVRVPSSLTRT